MRRAGWTALNTARLVLPREMMNDPKNPLPNAKACAPWWLAVASPEWTRTPGRRSMAEDEATAAGSTGPAGPFLRQYAPTARFAHVNAQRASVVFYRNGGYSVITASGVQHVDKRVLARPQTVCEIALGTHVTTIQIDLPAAGGNSFFTAEVEIQWTVTDPYLVAVKVVTDVGRQLTAPVLERLREVTSTYRVPEAERASRAITRECASGRWDDLGAELGLSVQLYVQLGMDDRTIEHGGHLPATHAEAERTQMLRNSFLRMLQGGELEQLSFMLAADPEAAKDFLEKIRQEGRNDERERVDRLYAMALRGDLQPIDVEAQLLSLLNQDRNYRPIQGPIGSMPARRESRQLEPSADAPFTPDWLSADPPSHAGDEPSGKSAPEGKAVRDDVALDEIELCGELIVAASAADDRLSLEAIDEVLGVAEERAAPAEGPRSAVSDPPPDPRPEDTPQRPTGHAHSSDAQPPFPPVVVPNTGGGSMEPRSLVAELAAQTSPGRVVPLHVQIVRGSERGGPLRPFAVPPTGPVCWSRFTLQVWWPSTTCSRRCTSRPVRTRTYCGSG